MRGNKSEPQGRPQWHNMRSQAAFDALVFYPGYYQAKNHHEARHKFTNYDAVCRQFWPNRTEEDLKAHNDLKLAMKMWFEHRVVATQPHLDRLTAKAVAQGFVPWVHRGEAVRRGAKVHHK